MRRAAALAACAWLAAAPALAQTEAPPAPASPPTTVEGLTVEASKAQQAGLPDLVDRFVAERSVAGRIGQLSRWGSPPCPLTAGLSPQFDAFVSARVKTTAARVGAPVERRPNRNFPCRTNVLVVFTNEPQALMDEVRRRRPQLLGFHDAAQADRLARVERPMQAWYVTGTQGGDGWVVEDDEFYPGAGGVAGSRLTARVRSQLLGVLVVVDANRTVGRQIGALADAVAMLTLSRGGALRGCSALPTILNILDDACPQAGALSGLTPYDVAYLKGLYSTDPETYARAQESEIGRRVLREVAAPAPR